MLVASAARAADGQSISIRLSLASEAVDAEKEGGRSLSLQLLERLVTEQFGGQLEAAAGPSWLELSLPQGASILGRTLVL